MFLEFFELGEMEAVDRQNNYNWYIKLQEELRRFEFQYEFFFCFR
jgi:hypothetical protein